PTQFWTRGRRRWRASPSLPPDYFLARQLGDHGEQRHVERDHDATDGETQNADDRRLQQRQHVFGRRVHFLFVEVGDLLQHVVHGAGGFADSNHLRDHVGEHTALPEWIHDGPAFL